MVDSGAGWAEASGHSGVVDVHIGTLSKAVGCQGGFVAGPTALRALLVSRARTSVFSTAIPAPIAAAALCALKVARQVISRVDVVNVHVCSVHSP